MVLSGSTLPQVSAGGALTGTLHIVTSDGAGPYKAMINADGTGQSWTEADVTQQVPGKNGNIRKTDKRWWVRALQAGGLVKRATNINEDFPFTVAMPADLQCTGTVAGQANACVVKLINPSRAGPFGGCVTVQQAGSRRRLEHHRRQRCRRRRRCREAGRASPGLVGCTGDTAGAYDVAQTRRKVLCVSRRRRGGRGWGWKRHEACIYV